VDLPISDVCGPNFDCSFDIKLTKCECSCHA
jgi:hypothetical protein